MACISCGVITSAWLCRISSFWLSAIKSSGLVQFLLIASYRVRGPVYTACVSRSLILCELWVFAIGPAVPEPGNPTQHDPVGIRGGIYPPDRGAGPPH